MVERSFTLMLCLVFSALVNAAQITIISESFEGSTTPLNWSLTGDWQIGTPSIVGPTTAYQGTRCAATNISGNYSTSTTSYMTTPAMSLPATASLITFSFYEWVSMESCCDYLYIDISLNGGSTWSSLRSGTNMTNTVWTQRSYDLTAYKGSNVMLRFRFTTDASGVYPGWYIDNVAVTATVLDTANFPHIAVAPGSFRIGANDSLQKSFTICNTGIKDTLQYTFSAGANVLAWTYGVNTSSSTYLNTVASINQKIPGATITPTATTDTAVLRQLLSSSSVFLIPSQEYTSPSYTIGAMMAPVLNSYVRSGGVVIVLCPYYAGTSFLSYAGLDTLTTNTYTSSSYLVTVANAAHPVFDSVSSSIYTNMYTGYWLPSTSSTVLATYSGYAVATEKKQGNGYIYLLGYDFYSANTSTWGIMLTNCIKKGYSNAKISLDSLSGRVAAGSCKNLRITFNRSGLQPGTNIMQIRIQHNASLEPNPLSVPCTLFVDSTQIPHIAVAPGSFKIGPTDSAVKTLTVCNTGTRDTLQYSFNRGAAVLVWTYGASISGSSYLNTIAAIQQRIPGATITTTTTTDSAVLRQLLRSNGVFLIPSQEYTSPSYTIGAVFAPVLDNYVRSGGVVIVISPYYAGTSFLSYAGLDTLSTNTYTSSSYLVTITNPTHSIFDSVATPVYTNAYTSYWTRASSSTILATYSSYAVLSEKAKGAGYIYLFGYNFYYADNTVWGRMLANCIKKGVSSGAVTPDSLSGKVAPGACKAVRLTFNRTGMLPGTQVVQLRIQHNAVLNQNPLSVACTLSVDSTTMTWQPPVGMAASISTGDTAVKLGTITNTGSSLLNYTISGKGRSALLINEVNNYNDFVELVNPGNADVSIAGYRLVWTDNNGSLGGTYIFPAGSTIRAKRFVVLYGYSGTSTDSLFYLNTSLGWTSSTELSVSLLDASGRGVDFFKTSLDSTLPPAGTTWKGAGFVRSSYYYNYYRTSLVDNNTASDWAGSTNSSDYTYFALNPGQSFSVVGTTSGYITVRADSSSLSGGQSSLIRFRYDAVSMVTGGVYIDTFQIIHNAKNATSPITVICTLTVRSNIPVLIPVTPDPTINMKPAMKWHPVPSATVYTIEVSQMSSFTNLLIIQQTADSSFTPLVNLPAGTIFWRVRSDLNPRPSPADNFVIQKDSIPILIPITPDTISGKGGTVFSWHTAKGATSYKILITRVDTFSTIVQSFVTDTSYTHPVALPKGTYVWTVSANFDFTQTAFPDTFWVGVRSAVIPVAGGKLPTAFALDLRVSGGAIKALCALPGLAGRTLVPLSVALYDIKGKQVRMLYSGYVPAGYYQFGASTESLANGIYFCRMRWPGSQKIAPVHLIK